VQSAEACLRDPQNEHLVLLGRVRAMAR
jgi:hypothetical protein